MTSPSSPTGTTAPVSSASHLVFIDRAVAGYAALAAALPDGYEAILVDAGADGLDQVAQALEGRSGIDAIAIVGHGADGLLALGTTRLDVAGVEAYAPQLAALGAALAPGADLLLYGCDIAGSADGRALADALAAATGADVAASTDASGAQALGANWRLEYHTGDVAADSLVPAQALDTLGSLLAVQTYVRTTAPVPEMLSGGGSQFLLGDFDGDGDMDMMRQPGAIGSAIVYFENQGGVFAATGTTVIPAASGLNLSLARAIDIDGDGDLDFYQLLDTAGTDFYYVNNGGAYSRATAPLPEYTATTIGGFIAFDFDGDGDQDILRQDGGTGSVPIYYKNNGGVMTVSTDVTFPLVPDMTFAAGRFVDFDGDGDLDFYFPNSNGTAAAPNDVYLRNDNGTFAAAPNPVPEYTLGAAPNQMIVADFDGDGDMDMIYKDGTNIVFLKNTDGTLAPSTDVVVPSDFPIFTGRAVDFDGDGDVDLYAQVSGPVNDYYLEMPGAPPKLTGSSLTDGATPVDPGADIVLRFSETVFAGAGNVYVHRASDGAVVATIAATDSAVGGSGTSEITIDPGAALAANTTFYLTFDTHAFADADGAVFGRLDFATMVRVGQDDPQFLRFTTGTANAAPTLGNIGTLTGATEDTATPITFARLAASGNEADSDGNVVAFVVKAVSSGTLKIGADAASASAWAAGSNDVIDASHLAFWTPAQDANGNALAAFTVVARDDGGADSATPVQVRMDVAAVNDAPTLANGTSLSAIQEDATTNPGDTVASLLAASGFADADGHSAAGIAISANGADPLNQGHWEYATDAAGTLWHAVGNVSTSSALLLSANAHLRFVPVADYAGAPGALTVRALDSSGPGLWTSWNGSTETRVTYNLNSAGAQGPVSTNGAAWGITVDPMKDMPAIANLGHGDDQTIDAGNGPALVDLGANATVSAVDHPDFAGGWLNVTIAGGRDPNDTFGLQGDAGIPALASFVSGSDVIVDGTVIGTVRALSKTYNFTIDLNAAATPATISTLLQHLTFSTTGVDGTRTVRTTLFDSANDNSSPGANDTYITVVSKPTLSITSDLTTLKAGAEAMLTLTFSAAPTGFALDDLTVAGGTVKNLQATADPLKFTATFTPDAHVQDLHASISIEAGKFSAGGKDNAASAGPLLIGGDTLAPTVTVTTSTDTVKAGQTATVTFTFSEAPAGFTDGAISVNGGQLTNLHATTQDNTTWEATFTPDNGVSTVTGFISLDAGAYHDAAGNDGAASNLAVIGGDTQKPVVSPGAFTISGATGPNDTFRIGDTVTVSWSGETNTDIDKVLVDLRDFGGTDGVAATFADGKWTASLLVGAGGFDDSNAYVAVTVVDTAGNDTWSIVKDDIRLDSRVPFVRDAAIDLSGTPTGLDGSWRIGDTISASWTPGAVTTDTASVAMDFSQFGGGASVAATLANGKWTASYTIAAAVLPDGPRNVKVTATDDVGNTDSAYDGTNPVIDASRPAIAAIALVGTPAANATSVQFLVTLSEAVTGLDQDDFVLHYGGGSSATIAAIAGSGTSYTVTVEGIAGNGSLRLDLKDSGTGIVDAAGNGIAGGYTAGAVHTASFNAAPVITSNAGLDQATIKIAEHQAAVATVAASDADHDTLTYSIDGGADAALFAIDAATGALTFKNAPAWAASGGNSYEVKVGVADGHGGSDSQFLTVQVLGDTDGDGTPDETDDDIDGDGQPNAVDDAVPNAHGDGHGDANGDGIQDSIQANVASIQTAATGNPYATLAVADGYTLGSLGASAAPATGLPRGVKLPLGQLEFTIDHVAPGGTVEMAIYVDASLKVNAYYKQDASGAWKNIAKSVTTVGTKTKITFDLTDGGPLDSDHTVNGSISDPGILGAIAPQITSDGGELVASVRVAENTTAVTTVTASAFADVAYRIVGGEDAALFQIDAHTGALRFVAAPDFEKPLDQGAGAKNNTYVVQVEAFDDNGSETQTVTVRVTDVDESAPIQSTVIDGVTVVTGTQLNGDGSTSQVTTVPVVQPGRSDSVGNPDLADIALATSGGKDVLTAQLPTGYGLTAVGQAAPATAGTALADLVREIKAHTATGSADRDSLMEGGSGFLDALDAATPLLVRSVTPTSADGASHDAAIVLSGLPATTGGVHTALVIDTSGLSGTTQLQLQNVDFAAIIGAAHVTGGDGAQQVWGDSASQYIVLGAADDTLHGGDGDDTVGSAGGNDHIYGDGGNDVVFGGSGDDHIDGGSGIDTVLLAGASRADYSLRVKDGMLVSTALAGTDGIDTIVDVEIMQFAAPDTSAAGTIGRLYEGVLDRAADTAGREFWVAQYEAGTALETIAAAIVGSSEALQLQRGNADYVAELYRGVLEREGDAGGQAFWTAQLDNGTVSRAGLALQFVDSAEKLAMPSSSQLDFNHSDVATLVRMYEALFDRKPDEGGLNFWIGMHESGVTMRALAQGFLASSESAAHYATLDDAHFVAELYQTALGHGPNAAEAAQWSAMLTNGQTTRADVLLGIADSDEMVQLVGTVTTSIETV